MKPEIRQRLLAFAQQLVDRKVSEQTYLGGDRTIITDRLISLQLGQPPPLEEPKDVWIRVWAEVVYSQVSTPGTTYPTKSYTTPAFPVFTLLPASRLVGRQNQLDTMEYYLDNAEVYSSPTSLLYPNSVAPLVLALNLSSWSQFQYPPFYPVYPGFFFSDADFLAPFRIGGPVTVSGDDVEVSATVTLYVRGHAYDTLEDFTLGGAIDPIDLTLRQVGTQDVSGVPGSIVALQSARVGYNGESFAFSPISTAFQNVDETVSLVGFELL